MQDVLLGEGAAVWGGLHVRPGQHCRGLLPEGVLSRPPRGEPAAILTGVAPLPMLPCLDPRCSRFAAFAVEAFHRDATLKSAMHQYM